MTCDDLTSGFLLAGSGSVELLQVSSEHLARVLDGMGGKWAETLKDESLGSFTEDLDEQMISHSKDGIEIPRGEETATIQGFFAKLNRELMQVSADGDCFFTSILAQLKLPEEISYDAASLRRQVVLYMAENPEKVFDYPTVLNLWHNYQPGEETGEGYRVPQEYSISAYLYWASQKGFWADQILLRGLCMMWRCSLTIFMLTEEGRLHEETRGLQQCTGVNFMTVYHMEHYMPIGKLLTGWLDHFTDVRRQNLLGRK